MREGNIFTLCVSPHLDGGGGGHSLPRSRWGGIPLPRSRQGGIPSQVQVGVPLPRSRQGGIPSQVQVGVPLLRSRQGGTPFPSLGGGTPTWEWVPPPGKGVTPHSGQVPGWGGTPYQSSIVCTCYAVGGVPLSFTQEDFLVVHMWVKGIVFGQE